MYTVRPYSPWAETVAPVKARLQLRTEPEVQFSNFEDARNEALDRSFRADTFAGAEWLGNEVVNANGDSLGVAIHGSWR